MENDKIRKNYKDIADAIRRKKGTHNKMTAAEMPGEVDNIQTGINPTGTLNINANGTYDVKANANVAVDVPVPEGYIQPEGTQEITANGEFNIREFEKVDVNVQSTGNNPLQDMLDRSSDTNGNNLFRSDDTYSISRQLTYENLITLNFSNKHYTSADYMFNNCRSLTTVPQLDFSSVTSVVNMFSGCSSLTTVPQLDFSSVTYATSMFNGCRSLTTVPQLNFSKVTNTSYMFAGCTGLKTIPQLDFSSVTKASDMFEGCTNLTTVPQLDFSSVTKASGMFSNCSSLTTLDFSNIKMIGASFANSSKLSTLIIRNSTTPATLENTNAFSNTPIKSGKGYIYVPDNLVDSYKQATNWSTFANQIKPLSELPQGK